MEIPIGKKKKRTNWRKLIRKHGLEKIMRNPEKYLKYYRINYSEKYLTELPYRLKKYKPI